jgi:hypothetical protein
MALRDSNEVIDSFKNVSKHAFEFLTKKRKILPLKRANAKLPGTFFAKLVKSVFT